MKYTIMTGRNVTWMAPTKGIEFEFERHQWANPRKIQHEHDCGTYVMLLAHCLPLNGLGYFDFLNSGDNNIFLPHSGEENKLRHWRAAIAYDVSYAKKLQLTKMTPPRECVTIIELGLAHFCIIARYWKSINCLFVHSHNNTFVAAQN